MKHMIYGLAAGISIALAPQLQAQEAAIYAGVDRIHPVWAKNGMVVAQEEIATRVGRDILMQGGNAVDAGVAVAFALAVTHPRAGNIGGGGFMMVYNAQTGETNAIDYREMAPKTAERDMFLDENGDPDSDKSLFTGLASGVPGTVAGMEYALSHYGTMTLSDVLAPAIKLAEEGFLVSTDFAQSLKELEKRLKKWPASTSIFYKGDAFYEAGDILIQSDLAQTLKKIAAEGADGFYKGDIAEKIAVANQAAGGRITVEDMAAYEVKLREPVKGEYRGYEVISMPPPSSGGVHIIQMLNVLEGYPIAQLGANSAQTIHLMAETMKRAYADRSEYLGDPDFVDVPVSKLTSSAYADAIRAQIQTDIATPSAQILPADLTPYESNQTTHFSIVDKDGNAVSNTYTLNFSYGSGMVADGTGVLMNNEMDDFSAKPGTPNGFGLIGGDANAVEPRKRPLSSMSPTMVRKDGQIYMVTGSPGGSRIITTTMQTIMNVIDHGMNVAEASISPRVHHQWMPDELRIEEGISLDTQRLLQAKGHSLVLKNAMGSTQIILRDPKTGHLYGASDTRQMGSAALGY